MLFVAHRNEILSQASAAFARVRPQDPVGFYHGDQKDPGARLLFANIATMQKANHLSQFARGAFDYIVIDEFHGRYQFFCSCLGVRRTRGQFVVSLTKVS